MLRYFITKCTQCWHIVITTALSALKRKIKISTFNQEQVEIMTWKKTPIQIETLHWDVSHNFFNPIYAFELQTSNL